MPGNWTSIETNFPTFTGKESVSEQIAALQNYMFILTEQLKYNLNNLDTNNWNSAALKAFSTDATSDVVKGLEEQAKRLSAVASQVSTLAGRLADAEQKISTNAQSIKGLEGRADALEVAHAYLESRVLAAEENVADLQEDAARLEAEVTGEGGLLDRMDAAEAAAAELEALILPQDDGWTLGAEGKMIRLVGSIYINGKEVTA